MFIAEPEVQSRTTLQRMARRPSAFPVESELSLSQTDEIRLRKNKVVLERRRPVQSLSEGEKRRRVWTIYFIGFVVSSVVPSLKNVWSGFRGIGRANQIAESVMPTAFRSGTESCQ